MTQKKEKQSAASHDEVRQIVERAVAESLEAQVPQLQSKIVEQVLQSLPATGGEAPRPGSANSGDLVRAVAAIHTGSTQKEILRALLDSCSGYSARIALFVVKAGTAPGWQARGFGDDEAVKDYSLDLNAGPIAHTFQNRVATPANIAEMGKGFASQFGAPANEQVLVLPLLLKDKVAAIVYADGGDSGLLDSSALELLVMATSAWLEVASLRKQSAPKEDAGMTPRASAATAPSPVQTVASFSDPFAGHTPRHSASSRPTAEPAEVVEVAQASAAAPAVATDPLAGLSPEDADTHRKAQRFARLLVDEIKLYNQAKVAEGRRNKDLYDRLKEDIEKSRGTFQKRYGGTIAASGNYFHQELLRSLAEDDASIMGANFR